MVTSLHTNLLVLHCMEFIIRTFTTSLHTPFTSVPKPGAVSQPLVHGTKRPYSYTGSDKSDLLFEETTHCEHNLPSDSKTLK